MLLLCILKFSSCCPKELEKHHKVTVFDSINVHDSEMALANRTDPEADRSCESLEEVGVEVLQRTKSKISKNTSQVSVNSSRRQQSISRTTKF